jgi:hypothetical protein
MEGRGGIVVEEQEELSWRGEVKKRRKMPQPPMTQALV